MANLNYFAYRVCLRAYGVSVNEWSLITGVLFMCGIVGAIAQRPIAQILLVGLKSLEYRGYDSSGLCLRSDNGTKIIKTVGKVAALEQAVQEASVDGFQGIAHTRWATHGKPSVVNAHPHQVGDITIVHNGIIENYQSLKQELISHGYEFKSDTDTEVLAALIHYCKHRDGQNLNTLEALNQALAQVHGSYALGVMDENDADAIYIARMGSPLVVGVGIGENFVASDVLALLPVTSRFIYLEDGDRGVISRDSVELYDAQGSKVERECQAIKVSAEVLGKGPYKHYMQKEIFEQPEAITNTMMGRLGADDVEENAFMATQNNVVDFKECLKNIEHIEIAACGTSYHAGLVGKYFIEEYAAVSTNVTIASEYRYKRTIVPKNSLFITLSQSGETADTLAALKLAKTQGYAHTLCICNVANSSLVRESEYAFLTRAGAEIGVASTKAFTTQLLALSLLTLAIGRARGTIDSATGAQMVKELHETPAKMLEVLKLDKDIENLAPEFAGKEHSLFLGRGPMFPIALEGALKLKEISYIHAEGYASGELKHGPIALIDSNMPVIVVAPDNQWLPKLISNIEEVRARGGKLYVFSGTDFNLGQGKDQCTLMAISKVEPFISPMIFTIPLQLLAYHVAVINGTDVDQPRNLAKSVTVE